VVTGDAFGRQLVFGSVSYEHHLKVTKYGTVGLVGFVDSAHATDGLSLARPRVHTDVGLGARFHSSDFGSIRIDVGYGLRDRNFEISTGFVKPWPRR
jgi:outer membrane translocation and assembly module TamA